MKQSVLFSLKTKLLLFCLLVGGSLLAQKTITGNISDDSGEPLIGVNVLEKNSSNGTVTDIDGNFSLSVEGPQSVLTFSYVGYGTQEIAVGGQSTMDVTMRPGLVLQEAVVTGLNINKDAMNTGYSAPVLKSEALEITNAPNFASALYGKVSGVSVRTTPGGATSGINLNIRGFSSITGSTQPLIIMDGIPIRNGEFANTSYWSNQRIQGNGLVDINMDDVESISFLKGASAAALYGSEAVNGVVIITSKNPTKNGLAIDFNMSLGTDQIAYLPRYQNVRGPGYPLSLNDGGQEIDRFFYRDVDGDGTPETKGLLGTTLNYGPEFDGSNVIAWDGQTRPYNSANNSYADLFQNAQNSNFNLAINTGDQNLSTRISFTRQDNKMISFGSKNEKNIVSLISSLNASPKAQTQLNIKYINQYTHNRPYKVDRMINNFGGMMDRFESADWYFDKYKTSQGYRFVTGNNASLTPDENLTIGGQKNAILDYVWRLNEHNLDERSNRIVASVTQNWDVTERFSLNGVLGTDFTMENLEDRRSTERPSTLYNNPGGYFGITNRVWRSLYGRAGFAYNQPINEIMNLTIRGGFEANRDNYSFTSRGTSGGLSTENFFDISSSTNTPSSGSSRTNFLRDAFYGIAEFNYNNMVNVEGTIRRDRTSTISPENNRFLYPSVNTSILLHNMLDMPNYVDYFKLRGSYGEVGNYPEIYRANIAYNQNSLGVQAMGGQPVLYTSLSDRFGNDRIKPERKKEFEFGLEFALWQRLKTEFTYYNGKIVDQILPLTIASSSGAKSVLTNIGILRNSGIELQLDGDILRKNNWYWNAILNLNSRRDVVEKLANNADELLHADYDGNAAQLRSVVGQPMGDLYAHPIATDSQGRKLVDGSGLYQLDGDTWEKYGNAMPKFEGGFVNNISYKGVSLNIVTDFSQGGAIMPTGVYWLISRGLTEESLNYRNAESGGLSYYVNEEGIGVQTTASAGPNGEPVFDDGILVEGFLNNGEPNTNVISQSLYYAATYNWGGPQYGNSRYELYINKNNWWKVRELALGYTFPKELIKGIGAKNIRLSVYGRNLFFLYRSIKDIDPEQTTAGSKWWQNVNNAGNNPSFKSYGLMLRTSF